MEGQGETRPFSRRRPPSPQATRLMIISLVASLGLAAGLAYVFLPVLLFYEDQPRSPNYQLAASDEGSTLRITVVGAFMPGRLEEFEVLVLVDDERHMSGPLPDGIPGLMTFIDANGNGLLDQTDYFLLQLEEGKTYRLLILPVERETEEGVGFIRWPP